MLAEDRVLLARVAKVNQGLGAAIATLLDHLDDGQLPPAGLRDMAGHLDTLAIDLRNRARAVERTIEG